MAEYMGFEGLGKSQRIGVRGAARLAEEHGYKYEMLDNGKVKIFTPDGSRTFGPNVKAGSIGKFFGYAKGGAVPMERQMDMFEDGGLLQEGGSVDEESGNDVPTGSLKEEVRDDIPAQLSEGEFVFPADVVRYWGLDKLMEMRQQAKAGLQRMEDMGQMGNSEEATLPDDIPFDINDLDMEDEPEYNMAVGGFIQPQAGYGTTVMQPTQPIMQSSMFANYAQQPATQPVFQPIQQQPTTPVAAPTYTAPTYTGPSFQQLLPTTTGQYDEMKTYVNAAGEERVIPFVNGQPIYPIPAGFTLKEEAAKAVEETPTAVTTKTTRVTDRGGRDIGDTTPGATMAFGGKVNPATGLVEGATQYSVAYPDAIPSMATVLGLVTGSSTLSDLTGNQVSLTNPATNQTITMSKTQYAEMKADPRGNETMQMLSDMEEAAAAGVAKGDTEADVNNAISLLGETYGFTTPKGMTMEEAIAQVAKAERAGNKGIKGEDTGPQAPVSEGISKGSGPPNKGQTMAERGGGTDVGGGTNADGSVGGGAVGGGGAADAHFNKGGKVTKKMKRGGLASKK